MDPVIRAYRALAGLSPAELRLVILRAEELGAHLPVGLASPSAERMRRHRERHRASHSDVTSASLLPSHVTSLDKEVVDSSVSSNSSNGLQLPGITTSNRSEKQELREKACEVLRFLNEKASRNYRETDTNLKLISARISSGVSVSDCKSIIAKKTREWKGNPEMAMYLRPATLFRPLNFEQYLGELT